MNDQKPDIPSHEVNWNGFVVLFHFKTSQPFLEFSIGTYKMLIFLLCFQLLLACVHKKEIKLFKPLHVHIFLWWAGLPTAMKHIFPFMVKKLNDGDFSSGQNERVLIMQLFSHKDQNTRYYIATGSYLQNLLLIIKCMAAVCPHLIYMQPYLKLTRRSCS